MSARDEQTPQSRPPADAPVQAPGHGPGHGPGHQPVPAANGATDHRNGVPTAPLYGSPAAPRQPGFPLWIVPLVLLPLLVAVAWIFGSRWRAEQALQRETAALSATATAGASRAQVTPTQPSGTPVGTDSGVVIVETLQFGDPVREQVLDAVDRFWRVLGDAVYDLDTSELSAVASGEELERQIKRVQDLKAEGIAIYPVIAQPVSQAFRIRSAEAEIGVRVKYKDQGYLIDPATKRPIVSSSSSENRERAGDPNLERDVFLLIKSIDREWKVVRSFSVSSVSVG